MTSFDMNRFLRGQAQYEPQSATTDAEQSPESIARAFAGKADGGAGREGRPDPAEADFLRLAYRTHRGF